jgi:wyosine [tRNA(Phe)-imidazoG37] synthetase (radical SAM superfamily)
MEAFVEAALLDPRKFLGNQFVYAMISQRGGGLSVGINMNPDKACNFDCLYCYAHRDQKPKVSKIDVPVMSNELKHLLAVLQLGKLHEVPEFSHIPEEFLQLKQIALSGDGEPTCCANFLEIVEEIFRIRSNRLFPKFKLVLITNGTGLHLNPVRKGLEKFLISDEIWIKLDGGSLEFLELINQPKVPMEVVFSNIMEFGRKRPIVIQSLFSLINDQGPSKDEIESYIKRLIELKDKGVKISLVQIYSASCHSSRDACKHLPFKKLSEIAKQVREKSLLRTEVF